VEPITLPFFSPGEVSTTGLANFIWKDCFGQFDAREACGE